MLLKFLLHPYPVRAFTASVLKNLRIGSYAQRLAVGAVDRPHYGYCLYHAAALAARLRYPRISVIEFGVAGGNGLVNLESHAIEVSKLFPVKIDIFGFDTGAGLPAPAGYKDLPYMWRQGDFKMDEKRLAARLSQAKLVLGDIKETLPRFLQSKDSSPVGAVFCDVDLYSSTQASLKLFDADPRFYLPRVFCYFDDIIGSETELYNDYTGQRLAIREFNE